MVEVRLNISPITSRKHLTKHGALRTYRKWTVHSVPVQELESLTPTVWRLERDYEKGKLTLILEGTEGRYG